MYMYVYRWLRRRHRCRYTQISMKRRVRRWWVLCSEQDQVRVAGSAGWGKFHPGCSWWALRTVRDEPWGPVWEEHSRQWTQQETGGCWSPSRVEWARRQMVKEVRKVGGWVCLTLISRGWQRVLAGYFSHSRWRGVVGTFMAVCVWQVLQGGGTEARPAIIFLDLAPLGKGELALGDHTWVQTCSF